MLATSLARKGHRVVWWTSTFDHSYKRQRYDTTTVVTAAPGIDLILLHGSGYRKNVSLRRLLDHYQLARAFKRLAPAQPRPDVVFSTVPTVELASAAVRFARDRRIPTVVDVRDLWPDILVGVVPAGLRSAARLALSPSFRAVRYALANATGLTAVSPSYLDWALGYAGRAQTEADRVFPLAYPRLCVTPGEREGARAALLRCGVDPSKTIFWFIGMLGRTYDLTTVVRAVRLLPAPTASAVQIVISGSGDAERSLRAEANGLANVALTGWVTQPEIAYLMEVSSVGLAAYAPNAPQSYPNKYFEYMHGALPILSSLAGSGAALLERHECGLTYRAGDAADLAKLIALLAHDHELRERLAANSRTAYDQFYGGEAVYGAMADHLIHLAKP
jgi:glycosyltransferase involved in cell wall biosynthesis